MILTYADIDDIKKQNQNNEISNYILQDPWILKALSNVSTAKLISVIGELNIVFTNIEFYDYNEITSYIINECRYEICPIMIQNIMELITKKIILIVLHIINY